MTVWGLTDYLSTLEKKKILSFLFLCEVPLYFLLT